MAGIECLFYDKNVDHLTIYKSGAKISSTVDTGLALISLNKKKEIVGIELMGAHKNFNIPLEILQTLAGCIVQFKYHPHAKSMVVNITLKHKKHEEHVILQPHVDFGETAFEAAFTA